MNARMQQREALQREHAELMGQQPKGSDVYGVRETRLIEIRRALARIEREEAAERIDSMETALEGTPFFVECSYDGGEDGMLWQVKRAMESGAYVTLTDGGWHNKEGALMEALHMASFDYPRAASLFASLCDEATEEDLRPEDHEYGCPRSEVWDGEDGCECFEESSTPLRKVNESYADLPIEELELGCRAYNILKRMGVDTFEHLGNVTAQDLNDWTSATGNAVGLLAAKDIARAQEDVYRL